MHVQWTAKTAKEALDLLQAAENLIEAHILAYAPGDRDAQYGAKRRWPSGWTSTSTSPPPPRCSPSAMPPRPRSKPSDTRSDLR